MPWLWLFDFEKYGSSPSAKPPARSYWLILIVLLTKSAKSISTSRTGSNVCVWRGSYSKGKSFYYLFLGFIACLNPSITYEWVKSSCECLRTHRNRLRFSHNVPKCFRNLLRIKHDFSNQGICGQVLNILNLLIRISNRLTNCKNWPRTVWFS